MSRALPFTHAAAGAAGAALALELVFQVLPVSESSATGYHLDPLVLTYPAHQRFTMSSGWDLRWPQVLQANNAGFVAQQDFVPDSHAVAFVGDSYIEASALDPVARPAAQLQGMLGDRPVYALGAPGTSLLDHAERIRLASQRWQVQDVVMLLALGDIRQSVCGSGQIAGPCWNRGTGTLGVERRAEAGWLKRLMRHSALAQYLYSQLKVETGRLWPALAALPAELWPGRRVHAPAARTPTTPPPEAARDEIAKAFFARIRPHVKGRLVILVDKPLPGRQEVTAPLDDSEWFANVARANGATVVDLGPYYAEHARRSSLSLALSPTDGHHNALGAALLARAAADGLRRAAGPWSTAPTTP